MKATRGSGDKTHAPPSSPPAPCMSKKLYLPVSASRGDVINEPGAIRGMCELLIYAKSLAESTGCTLKAEHYPASCLRIRPAIPP